MGSVIFSPEQMRASTFASLALLMLASLCHGQKKAALPVDYGMMQKKAILPFDYGMLQKKALDSDYGMQKKAAMGGMQKKALYQKKAMEDDDVHVYITISQNKGIQFGQKKAMDMDTDMMQKKAIMDSMQKKAIFQKKAWQKKAVMPLQKKAMYPAQKKALDYAMMQKKALGFGEREYGSDYVA